MKSPRVQGMGRLPIVFFITAALVAVGVIVQFFLAGLGTFAATDFDAHRALGWVLGIGSLLLVVLAPIAHVPRRLFILAVLLLGLSILQFVLANVDDVPEIAALHVVNALAIFVVAHALARRAWSYLPTKPDFASNTAA